ncbi:MAG: hypothetical protein M0P15_04360 [Bacteroides sp.]|nr:hypothetical protein [Bacteroides sp.]
MKDLYLIRKHFDSLEKSNSFNYMMLSRYKTDLLYYWGFGQKCEKHLYFGNYKKQMDEIIKLWKKLPKKPMWFRPAEIIDFKNRV